MLLSSATWLFPCLGRDCDLAAAWFSGLILVFVAFATLLVLRPPAAEGTGLRSWA
jgi:hypothetical protein